VICSLDAFILLLKKWMNESIDVCIMSIVRSSEEILSVLHVQGQIVKLTDSQCVITNKDKSNVATLNFSKCTFNYGVAEDVLGVYDARNYDDCIIVSLDYMGEHSVVTVLTAKSQSTL
jgi:hypothetical protein